MSRVVSASPYAVSAGDAGPRARRGPDAGLRPQRPRARPAQEHDPGRRGRSSTTSPTRTSRRSSGAWRTRRRRAATSSITCSSDRDRRARGLVRPAAALDARRRRSSSPAAAWTTRRSTRRCASTWPRCAATAPPSSTSRRTPRARPRSASTTRGDRRAWSAALVALGHRRIAFLAGPTLAVRRPPAAGRLSPRPGRGRASPFDERLVVSTGFNRDGGALARGRAARWGCAVHGDLRGQRPAGARGACSAWPSSGIAVPGRGVGRGLRRHPDRRPSPRPSLSTVRLPLHEIGRRGFAFAERHAGRRPAGAQVLPTELRDAGVDGAATARGRRDPTDAPRARLMAGTPGRPRRPRHRQQPRHRRRGRGQGRGRGRDRGGPLPPAPTARSARSRGSARRWRRTATCSPRTSPTAPRPSGLVERGHRPLRAHRRPRQQRRTDARRAVPRDRRRRTGTRSSRTDLTAAFHTCRAALPVDARARQRVDRQHRLAPGPDGRPGDRGVQRGQGRAHRPDPGARPRVRGARDPRQRGRARA